MSVDPSHYLPAANSGKPPLLKLQNISAKPELNGQFGQAVSYSAGRYVVALIDHETAVAAVMGGTAAQQQQSTMLKLKPENLSEAGHIDQLKFGITMILQSARAYMAGPTVQGYGNTIITKLLPTSLQSKVTPNQALLGVAIFVQLLLIGLYLLVGRFIIIGFQKLFILLSFLGLLLAISSPDWIEGIKAKKPWVLIGKNVMANFIRRWKENLMKMTGYENISEKMALGLLVMLVLFTGKVLMTTSSSSSSTTLSRPPLSSPMSMGDGYNNNNNKGPSRVPNQYHDLKHIYKLGFEDATSGKEFGTSLPEDILKNNNAAAQQEGQALDDDDDDDNMGIIPPYTETTYNNDWSTTPPPPPKSKSTLGMGTFLSMFTLYRFGKDIVTSPSTGELVLDPQYVMARLRGMDSWRLGMLAMSLYRVVTALSSLVW